MFVFDKIDNYKVYLNNSNQHVIGFTKIRLMFLSKISNKKILLKGETLLKVINLIIRWRLIINKIDRYSFLISCPKIKKKTWIIVNNSGINFQTYELWSHEMELC